MKGFSAGKICWSRDERRETKGDPSRGYGWEEGMGKIALGSKVSASNPNQEKKCKLKKFTTLW